MCENEAVFVDLLQKCAYLRDVQPMDEMYKRIRDGLNRWMRNVWTPLRDKFQEGLVSLHFGWIC